MADRVIVRDRDVLGRPVRTEIYGPGDPKPDWAQEMLAERETQVSDPRDEAKGQSGEVEHLGGPWYLLPDGEKVRGKDAVREAGFEVE